MEPQELDISKILKERFAQLPKVVQQSILSSKVEEHLRALAETHKLHLDQWVDLENEVMMVLLGLRPVEDLAEHIQEETNVTKEVAQAIAVDASSLIFDPIRKELERELAHPNAQPTEGDEAPRSVHSAPSSVRTTIEGDPYREALK